MIRDALRAFLSNHDFPGQNNHRILDIGCATGRAIESIHAEAPGSLFVGLDISPKMVRLAKTRRNSPIELLVGDIRCLPFRKGAFDFVYTLEVLEHLARKTKGIPAAVSEVMRVTRAGGSCTFESTSFWHFQLQEIISRGLPGAHVSLLQQRGLTRFSKTYRTSPLSVAEPSRPGFISELIRSYGGKIESTSWIRVIPEQTFVVLSSDPIRSILTRADELLTRLPGLRRLGREFVIRCVKTTG